MSNCRHPILLKPNKFNISPVKVPCGQCFACRVQRTAEWAARIMHEAQMHKKNCFVRLSYSPENLPINTLNQRHLALFFKKLRKKYKFRYFYSGEYGDLFGRAHYHCIFFGQDFRTEKERKDIEHAWNYGFIQIGSVTLGSARYTAKYIQKKLTGKRAVEYGDKVPPFAGMSRRPGIGRSWFEKYFSNNESHVIYVNCGKRSPPKYYKSLMSDKWNHRSKDFGKEKSKEEYEKIKVESKDSNKEIWLVEDEHLEAHENNLKGRMRK